MRKSINTLFLILLLIGPSMILACVRPPSEEENKVAQSEDMNEATDVALLYADVKDIPRP